MAFSNRYISVVYLCTNAACVFRLCARVCRVKYIRLCLRICCHFIRYTTYVCYETTTTLTYTHTHTQRQQSLATRNSQLTTTTTKAAAIALLYYAHLNGLARLSIGQRVGLSVTAHLLWPEACSSSLYCVRPYRRA